MLCCRYYNNFNVGEFVLYRHTTLPYEVTFFTSIQNQGPNYQLVPNVGSRCRLLSSHISSDAKDNHPICVCVGGGWVRMKVIKQLDGAPSITMYNSNQPPGCSLLSFTSL